MLAPGITLLSLTHTSIFFMGSPSSRAILSRNWRATSEMNEQIAEKVWLDIVWDRPAVEAVLSQKNTKIQFAFNHTSILIHIQVSVGGNQ